MVHYNKSQQKVLDAGYDIDTERQTPIEDYRTWVQQLAGYSGKFADPALAAHARGLADDAGKFVGLIERVRNVKTPTADPLGIPGAVDEYVRLSKDAQAHMEALNAVCPAG